MKKPETGRSSWICGARSINRRQGDIQDLTNRGKKKGDRVWQQASIAAKGVGEVTLRCIILDGEQVVTLKEVYYIFGVAVNLFLV
jgi:hypothetical protein